VNQSIRQRGAASGRIVRAMIRLGSLVIAASIAASLNIAVAAAPPAGAQTPGCVSEKELIQIQDHTFTKLRVHRIFETRGHVTHANRWLQTRRYEACWQRGRVELDYRWDGSNAYRMSFISWWTAP